MSFKFYYTLQWSKVALLLFLCSMALTTRSNVAANVLNSYQLLTTNVVDENGQSKQLFIHLEDQKIAVAIMSPRTGKNLTDIKWAHAVNSQYLLKEALSGDIDMIEADIVLGKLNGVGEDIPVMAHPPSTISDLTLEDFLQQIKVNNDENDESTKGVKLDFKSIEVFEGSLDILDETIPKMTYPVWLNADVISGPVNQNSTVPVDPSRFFAGCMRYKQAVLSIGWTTRWNADTPKDSGYTQTQLNEMLDALQSNNVLATGQPITFPVRAGIAANSAKELHELVRAVNTTNDCTLTVWSSDGDYVDIKKLRELIFSFGVERVYLDVPAELANQLDLGRGGCTARVASLTNFAMISLTLWALSMWLKRIKA